MCSSSDLEERLLSLRTLTVRCWGLAPNSGNGTEDLQAAWSGHHPPGIPAYEESETTNLTFVDLENNCLHTF